MEWKGKGMEGKEREWNGKGEEGENIFVEYV